jgi:hypothetical protein
MAIPTYDMSFINAGGPQNVRSIADFAGDVGKIMDVRQKRATMDSSITTANEQAKQQQLATQDKELDLQNKRRSTFQSILTPYQSDERVLGAANLPKDATPEQIKQAQTHLFEVGDEVVGQLVDQGWNKADAMKIAHSYNDTVLKDPRKAPQLLKQATQTLAGASNIATQNQATYGPNKAGLTTALTPSTGQMNVVGQQPGQEPQNPNPSEFEVETQKQEAGNLGKIKTEAQNAVPVARDRLAVYQNMKALGETAKTGVPTAVWQNALGKVIGVDPMMLRDANTQELAKNTNLLSLAGGDTDLARKVAEMANPNIKMSKEARDSVINQLGGIENRNIAKDKYLQSANTPAQLKERVNKFNEVNDPRLFQEYTPEEMKRLKESMSPQAKAEMDKKVRMARMMGIL